MAAGKQYLPVSDMIYAISYHKKHSLVKVRELKLFYL